MSDRGEADRKSRQTSFALSLLIVLSASMALVIRPVPVVDQPERVDPSTLFAAASTTKAFTL